MNNFFTIVKPLIKHLGLVLFFLFLLIAIFSFDEYGVSWDEPQSRNNGKVSYNYIFENNPELLTYWDKDYGVAFELPLYIVERVFKLEDTRDIYLMRHFTTHLFFLIGAYFFFLLVKHIHKSTLIATIGFLILVLHPRIYAHSFFNSKDIPFMCMFIIGMYYMIKSLESASIINLLKLSIVIGLLINIRIMGIIIPFTYIALTLFDGTINKTAKKWHKSILLVIGVSSLTLYLSWPYLWINPIDNFIEAFKNMSKFRWDNYVVFNGDIKNVKDIGWSYIPVWFSITIPTIHLFIAIISIGCFLHSFFKSFHLYLKPTYERNNLLFLILFLGPILIVILLKSVLYDSWRQLFFVYPSFILVILYGIMYFKNKLLYYRILTTLVFISFAFLIIESVRNYPNQHVYFNELVSKNKPELVRKNYEQDYWGISSKQAIEYVLEKDKSKSILFCFDNKPGYNNLLIINKEDRKRIQPVNMEQCTYLVTNFRWKRDAYDHMQRKSYFSIKRNNSTIAQVFKLK